MEILNNFFSGGKPKEEVDNVKDEYLQEAQEAVDIVDNGVEKGSFSEMTERLLQIREGRICEDRRLAAAPVRIVPGLWIR